MDFDLDQLLRRLLNTQKEYVQEDLEEYSCAMVIVFTADGQSYIAFPRFQDADSKYAEYSAIVERAKRKGATLIVTVNNAWLGPDNLDFNIDEWGDLDETNSRRSILLTARGSGMRSWSLTLGYFIKNGAAVFESEATYLENVVLNLLPNLPDARVQAPS